MSTISPLGVPPAPDNKDATKTSNDSFGRDAFMKLLVEQMRHQSPTDASDGQEWINQMTQFSILEQLQQQSASAQKANAAAYLGRTVSWRTPDGQSGEGTVEKVGFDGDQPVLTVGGHAGITTKDILELR
jgi:flagellar basal-body rod modification protein FlgD